MSSKAASGSDEVTVCGVNGRPRFPCVGCEVGAGKCSSWRARDRNGSSAQWDTVL